MYVYIDNLHSVLSVMRQTLWGIEMNTARPKGLPGRFYRTRPATERAYSVTLSIRDFTRYNDKIQ